MPTVVDVLSLVVGSTTFYDMPFGQERKSLKGEIPEEIFNAAVDMSMIDHIPDMIENGVVQS